MKSQDYTRQKTKKSKTNFYYSFLFLPKEKRDAIFTVYSFCRHSDDLVDANISIDQSRLQLDQWRQELEDCYHGNPRHPILRALQPVVERFKIPKQYFHDLIDGMEMDLVKTRYETFEELNKYCYHAASVVGLICIEIFGYNSEKTKEYAIDLGKALQLTNIMRDVGEDAQKDRIYLPQDELEQFGYRETDILNHVYNPAFIELMRFQDTRARAYFSRAVDLYEKRDHHLLFPAEIMRKIYFQILNRITEAEYAVYDKRIRINNWRKAQLALHTWLYSRWSVATQWVTTS